MNNNQLQTTFDVNGESIKLSPSIIKNYLTNGQEVSDSDYLMFVQLCKTRKLNPFLKEVYIIKYSPNHPAQIVVGKDAILKRALENENFAGKEHGVIVLDENNKLVYRDGSFKLPSDTLVGGWAKVYRKGVERPTFISVALEEIKNRTNATWKDMPCTMIEKVALVRALRETFIEDLSGMYDTSEMQEQEPTTNIIIEQPEPEEPAQENNDKQIKEQQDFFIDMNEL